MVSPMRSGCTVTAYVEIQDRGSRMQTLHNQRYMIMWRQEGVAPLLADFAKSGDLARVLSGTPSKKFDIPESLGLPRDPQCPLRVKSH